MAIMQILYEDEVEQDITKLDKAWSETSTFVLLPNRSNVTKEWVQKGMEHFPEVFRQNHFALLTSGSTGQPKLVIGSRERAEILVHVIHKVQDSEPAKQTVLALPLSYCYAFINQWLWSRVMKRELTLSGGFHRPDILMKCLSEAEDCLLCLIGAQIPLFVSNYGDSISFPGVIRLHFAGGPFPQNQIKVVQRFFPNAHIFNNYGCAEAMPRLTCRPLEDSDEGSNIGVPLPGIEMRAGNQGEILFRSPYRAVGFYDDSGFRVPSDEDWIPSGDFGEQIENNYWRIKGRSDEVFKRYGEKISIPQLLETVYSQWSGYAVFYREMTASGEEGHILVLSPDPTKEQVQSILQAFRKNHPRTHWPIRLESISSIPTLPSGKIDRSALRGNTNLIVHWKQRV
jgi:acyl-CoA synthetase (AMP-forming)/AMP-acid ligase II